jgi:hypothetical protein
MTGGPGAGGGNAGPRPARRADDHGRHGHIPDDDEAQSIVRRLLAGLPSGSYLAMYDGLDSISEAMTEAQQGYDDTGAMPYKLRSRARGAQMVVRLMSVSSSRRRPGTS